MLYYNTISENVLELLKNIQSNTFFSGLRLVGGTALALQYGHRKSIDIDLFGTIQSDHKNISTELALIGNLQEINTSKNINIYTLNGIKTDIVNYPYPWLESALITSGLQLAKTNDIAAMKLAAITNRGTKKDFIDIYFLLQEFSIADIFKFYEQKYADGSLLMVLKSLAYFDDADDEPMPEMLKTTDWEIVKRKISDEVKNYINRK